MSGGIFGACGGITGGCGGILKPKGNLIQDGVILKLGEYVTGGVEGWSEPSGATYTTDVTQVAGSYTEVKVIATAASIVTAASIPSINFTDFTNLKIEIAGVVAPTARIYVGSLFVEVATNGIYNLNISTITTATINAYIITAGTSHIQIKKLTLT